MTPQPASPWRKRTNTLRISARAARWCVLHTVAGWPATVPAATTIAASPVLGIAAAGLIGATGATTHRLQRWWWGWRKARIVATLGPTLVEAKLHTGDKPPRCTARVVRDGVELTVWSSLRTAPPEAWHREKRRLAHAWGAERVSISAPQRRRVKVRIVFNDPFAETIARPEHLTSELAAVPIGVDEYGHVVTVSALRSMLVGGVPGSGKSVFLAGLIAGLANRDDCNLILIDTKRTDLTLWADVAQLDESGRPAMARTVEEASALLAGLERLMAERLQVMDAAGCRLLAPSPVSPQIVVVIDEVSEIIVDKNCERAVRRLVRLGRAAGFTVVCATQRPSADKDSLPSPIRGNLDTRVGFRTRDRDTTQMIMGEADVADCHRIPPNTQGVGYLSNEHGESTLFRTFWLDDRHIAEIVAEHTAPQVALMEAV